jgi:hypothetical protein
MKSFLRFTLLGSFAALGAAVAIGVAISANPSLDAPEAPEASSGRLVVRMNTPDESDEAPRWRSPPKAKPQAAAPAGIV